MIDLTAYKLGETDQLVEVEFREELRQLILAISQQAQHSILIFSHQLDYSLYDTEELYEAIKDLAIKSHRTHIHILVHDARPMAQKNHRLLELARRISSHISIKVTAKEHQDIFETFIIFDDRAYIIQNNPDRYDARGNFYAPLTARKLSEQFHDMWQRGMVDSTLRRLSL
ncbi:MAG: hypothetical protein QNL62_22060 [Gammaproteobacteria bacterium]|nr:hypothetical protein [Gammaproteobacteria bacterium]